MANWWYLDGEQVEIGDLVEVEEADFEPEDGEVVKIGERAHMGQVRVRWVNPHIKPCEEWVAINSCTMIRRAA